ncbi:MAG: ABC transporter permease [Acidobacteriota bacterium]
MRSGARYLVRRRGLGLVALTSLAVSVGASAAIISVSSAVLVRPLPYDRPQDLVHVWRQAPGWSARPDFWDPRRLARGVLTPAMIGRWKGQSLPFADLAIVESWETGWSPRIDLTTGDGVERLRGTFATANVFHVLGVHPAVGRTFREDEVDVAVISDRLWRRRFGADPRVVGRTASMAVGRAREPRVVEIIGVLPRAVHFTYPDETEIWLPLAWSTIDREPPFAALYRVVARLGPGTSIETAEAAMEAFSDPADRTSRGPARLWLERVHDHAVGSSKGGLFLVSALTLLVLLAGAANAATAFAASTASRVREMRIRRALGASPARLARQAFTEAAAIALAAGVVGVAAVAIALPGLRAMVPAGLPGADAIGLDGWTLVGVFAAVVFSTLVAGLIPALTNLGHRDQRTLEDSQTTTMTPGALRLRAGLLGAQFLLVTALLIAGAMLVRSFWNVMHVEKGFDASEQVFAAEVQLMHPAYRDQAFSRYEGELLRRVRELPYVKAASVTSAIPLLGTDAVRRLQRPDGQQMYAHVRHVDPAYFDVMGIPLLRGRRLTDADADGRAWVAVVSQALADALYPGADPLGRFLEGHSGTRIVGVVADVRARSLLQPPTPAFYWPRALQTTNQLWLVVRTTMQEAQVAADLRRIVEGVYPGQPVQRLATLQRILDDTVSDRRAYAVIAGAFAAILLVLTGLGLSGHLSHVVAERSRDVAIRSALGASSRQRVQPLVRHVAQALAGGVVLAPALAYLSFPFVEPFVFGIDRADTASWTAGALVVTLVTVAALAVPAARALKLDAAAVLKSL